MADTIFKLQNKSKTTITNQSTEGAEFVWFSECKKGTGCEIICILPPILSSVLIVVNWL
jgi:hypothetical protein